MRLILASSSPRRRQLLSELIEAFDVIKPDVDETQLQDEAPLVYVERLSRQKAQAVAARMEPQTTVLAADTIVILAADTIGIEENGEILGKPLSAQDARLMLRRLRGRDHRVCTAFTLLHADQVHTEIVCTTVTMRDYSDAEIDAYIATGDPFDKAGSYAIQHEQFRPVMRIEGSYSNVVGLPVEQVRAVLLRCGFTLKPSGAAGN
jgi:septum formation protein